MPITDLDLIPYFVFLLFLAIAMDLALLLAWRRHKKKRRISGAGENKTGGGRRSFSSLFGRFGGTRKSVAQTVPEEADLRKDNPAREASVPAGITSSESHSADATPAAPASAPAPAAGIAPAADPQSGPAPTTRVQVTVDLPKGEAVRVTIESLGTGSAPPAVTTDRLSPSGISHPSGAGRPTAGTVQAGGDNPVTKFFHSLGTAISGAFASFGSSARISGRSLFFLALALYLLLRLIGLTHWPIFFFTDEAVQTNFAAELWKGGLTWHDGEVLPTFFENAGQYEMNFSVYVQLVPYLMFGKSVFVNRAVSVLITLLGAAAAGLILKKAFRIPHWWSGVLIFSMIPAWFLHSRTSFEAAEAVAFFAVFLYFYMLYRSENPRYLYPALFFGALCAYTYSPAQIVMVVAGVLLLFSDLRYHWQHKKTALAGLFLLALCSLPYVRFLVMHPDGNKDQLAIVSSLWLRDIPLLNKLQIYVGEWLKGFDPRYWYLVNPPEPIYNDIVRHLMKGYGHIALWTLPFGLGGLLICLTNLRSSAFRTLLIALIAAPAGAAMAQITITRSLFVVFPVALLTAIGILWFLTLFEARGGETPGFLESGREGIRRLLARLRTFRDARQAGAGPRGVRAFFRRWTEKARAALPAIDGIARIPRFAIGAGLFIFLAFVNIYMLWDGLANGPTWYTDYQLYGMQYGGEQLSAALQDFRQKHPESNFIVSTSWANGTDELLSFFLPEDFRYRAGTVDEYMQSGIPIADQDLFVLTPVEYTRAQASNRFAEIRVEETLPYPDGTPGFYFARLRYVPGILEIIQQEKAALAEPVEETLDLNGVSIHVTHSRFDSGTMASAFDHNSYSLIRTQTANPMILDMVFSVPQRFTSIQVLVGGGPTRLTAVFQPEEGGTPVKQTVEVPRSSDFRLLTITLPDPVESATLHLEVLTVGEGEPNHVHVYEMRLEAEGWTSGPLVPVP